MQNEAKMLMKCKNIRIVQFCLKTGKIKELCQKLHFWPHLHVTMTLPRGKNEQLLKVSEPKSKSPF